MLLLNIGLHNNKKVVYHYRGVLLSVFNFSYLFFLAALKFLANLDSLSWGGVKKWHILRKFPKQSFSFQKDIFDHLIFCGVGNTGQSRSRWS